MSLINVKQTVRHQECRNSVNSVNTQRTILHCCFQDYYFNNEFENINKFAKETRFSLQLDKEQFYGLGNKLMHKCFSETGVFCISLLT